MRYVYDRKILLNSVRPKCYLDKDYWSVWSKNPNEATRHGDYEFKWTFAFEMLQEKHSWNNSYTSVERLVIETWIKKFNEEVWEDDKQTILYSWAANKTKINPIMQVLFDDLLLVQKDRRKKITQEQNKILKAEAEKLNITVTDLKEKRKKERLARNPFKTTKLDVERTNRMVQVGPALKDLKDQIELIFVKANSNSKKLMPKTVDRSIQKIEKITRMLESWINNSQTD